MALVGYSDSEGSDSEPQFAAPGPSKLAAPSASRPASKPAFQKVIDPSAPRKIKVDLPSIKPDGAHEGAPPAKKPRTAGTFSGFNSFLPAPKRAAEASNGRKAGLGSGVNLRTGAEPAFSRERPGPAGTEGVEPRGPTAETSDALHREPTAQEALPEVEKPNEVKTVGNAMKFKPLSVARKKVPKKKLSSLPSDNATAPAPQAALPATQPSTQPAPQAQPRPKTKVSLFSVAQDDDVPSDHTSGEYQPLLSETQVASAPSELPDPSRSTASAHANPTSLDAIADDLNLSASARRQLFGRNKDAAGAAKVMHFNIDEEYKANEVLRAQGEAVEHRAVKAIAPGKHSLQQLVNAASTQKEALEDAWAAGKRNKAEGGSKYGW
ncbi:hypothetical protein MBLNU459_g2383t1 [Dothideomycetes sp. NU459]